MRRVLTVLGMCVGLMAGGPAAQQPAPTAPAAGPPPPSGQAPPASGSPAAQAPPIIFKTEVNYVEVDAVVTDQQGNFVGKLTRDDFEVLEDGKAQKVELFTEIDLPVARPERFLFNQKIIRPDTKNNHEPFSGRLYVIVLDDNHTNALRTTLVKRAARQFIEKNFGANDLAAIVTTSGRTDVGQEFTNDQALLLASIDKFMGQKLRSRTLERLDEYNRQRGMRTGTESGSTQSKTLDPLDFERGYKAKMTLGTLKNLANYLAGIRGRRKALLFFSEGIDYPIYDVFDSRDATDIVYETREAITAAARSNVNFYTIDPQGLIGLPGDAIELGAPPEDPSLRLDTQGMMDEVRLAQDSLRTLAEETGGIAMVNSNDFAKGFDNIVKANSKYYVLGYYPPESRRDGRFHKISVRVKRPGLRVTARKGYASPKGRPKTERETGGETQTSQALREVLNSPLPQSGIGLAVHAASFKGSAPNNSVALAIEIDGNRMAFKEEKGMYVDKLELSFYPVTDQGKPLKGTRSELDLKLKPETYQYVRAFGLRANPRLDLPPGRYQVRIGAREAGGGEVGSVFYDLQVPDFNKDKLTMSDVLITAATAQLTPTPMPDKQVEGVLPLAATARREFVKGDVLAIFAEVYDNLPPLPAHTVDITTKLVDDTGRDVFKTTDARQSKELQGAKGGGYGHAHQIPLKDVAPGAYLLRVEATSRLKDVTPVAREMLIRVHPQREQAPAQTNAKPATPPAQPQPATPPAGQPPAATPQTAPSGPPQGAPPAAPKADPAAPKPPVDHQPDAERE